MSRFFPPEPGAASERLRSFAYELASEKQTITVLTTYPSYPSYTAQDMENIVVPDHVRLIRIWTPRWGRKFRFFTDIVFCTGAFFRSFWISRPEILFTSSPPFFLGITALLLKFFRRIPYVFDVRDLYPDSLVDVGFLQNKFLKKFLYACERVFYRYAKHVTTVSQTIATHITQKTPSVAVTAIYNGVDKHRFLDAKKEYFPFLHSQKKKAIYIGNFGRVYDFEPCIEAAKKLPNWQFIFVGGGFQKPYLQSQKYITVVDSISPEAIPSLLQQCDLGIVSVKDIPLAQGSIPTKIFEYIAAGLPVAAKVYGEAKTYFQGYIKEFQSAEELIELCLKDMPTQKTVPQDFDRSYIAKKLQSILNCK